MDPKSVQRQAHGGIGLGAEQQKSMFSVLITYILLSTIAQKQ